MNTHVEADSGPMARYRIVDPPAGAVRHQGMGHAWVWPLLTVLAALAGMAGSMDAQPFYAQLDKPAWAPPGWVFGPVWTLLYVLMAIGAVQVARSSAPLRGPALATYALQLVANAAWSWAFFAWRDGLLALIVLGVLLALLVAHAVLFGQVRRSAGWLTLPSIAWVMFAGALNYEVWQRNLEQLSAVLGR